MSNTWTSFHSRKQKVVLLLGLFSSDSQKVFFFVKSVCVFGFGCCHVSREREDGIIRGGETRGINSDLQLSSKREKGLCNKKAERILFGLNVDFYYLAGENHRDSTTHIWRLFIFTIAADLVWSFQNADMWLLLFSSPPSPPPPCCFSQRVS